MKTWRNIYRQKYQIRTAAGRFISDACSKEQAEHIAEQGRGRIVYKYDTNGAGFMRYVFHKQY